MIHNFSLIHDDIEDNSPLRRGRPTVWVRWNIPQAINSGDALFTLAHLALLRLEETTSAAATLQATNILQNTCLHLTQGQYLDMSYESRTDLTLDDYWPMVSGKTAALIAASSELGALAADAAPRIRSAYRQFGLNLGLAFQAQDDLLGIWGNSNLTGKSAESDLVTGKKSLPILYGLSLRGDFYRRWLKGSIKPAEVSALADQLEQDGAKNYTQDKVMNLTDQALQALEQAQPQGEAGEALLELSNLLLNRQI
jgi:geranylgeranyl diphosphate synthase type I